ncbi:DUF1453 domain-containing protein [Renibacterium salmoninarum]|nr:DUF1453 domain-containing protein [Renibacterium salmoninarum]
MQSFLSGPVGIVIVIGVVAYVMIRRFLGEPVEAKRMLLLPVILSIIGLFSLNDSPQSADSILFLVITVTLGIAIGIFRGLTIRVKDRDGVAFLHYTWFTIGVWAVSLLVKFGSSILWHSIDAQAAQLAANSTMLSLGTGLLAEGLVVMLKAISTDSRIMWQKGQDGQAYSTSPLIDQLQQQSKSRSGKGTVSGFDRGPGNS